MTSERGFIKKTQKEKDFFYIKGLQNGKTAARENRT